MYASTLLRTLQHGQITVLGQFARSSNFTLLVECTADGESLQAVYKPARGQQPLWDFAGQPLSEALLRAVDALSAALAPGQLFLLELGKYLSDAETNSLCRRCVKLLADQHFPFPDEDRRAFPWPPV